MIIGLPDIKKHSLLSKFANQFNDCKVVNDKEGLKSPLVSNYPRGNSLSDKFANLSEDVTWVRGASGWLKSLRRQVSILGHPLRKRVYPKKNSNMRIRYAPLKRHSLIAGSQTVNITTMIRKLSNTNIEITQHGGRTTKSRRVKTNMA